MFLYVFFQHIFEHVHASQDKTVHTNMHVVIVLSYAAVAMATPWWCQTPNMVTASIKLKGISPDKIQGAVLVLRVHQWKASHLMSTC